MQEEEEEEEEELVLTLAVLSFCIDSSALWIISSFVEEPGAKPPFHLVSMVNCEPALMLPSTSSLVPYSWALSMFLTWYFLRTAKSASTSSLFLNARPAPMLAPPKMTLMLDMVAGVDGY